VPPVWGLRQWAWTCSSQGFCSSSIATLSATTTASLDCILGLLQWLWLASMLLEPLFEPCVAEALFRTCAVGTLIGTGRCRKFVWNILSVCIYHTYILSAEARPCRCTRARANANWFAKRTVGNLSEALWRAPGLFNRHTLTYCGVLDGSICWFSFKNQHFVP